MKSLGILGVGDLTEKVVQGLRRSDYCAPVYLCPRNQPRAESLAQSFPCKIMPDDQSVVDSADILLIGDRPDNLRALAGEITLDPSQDVISLVAGVSTEQLNKLFGSVRNVRAMLSCAAEINRTTVVITPYDAAAEALLSRLGGIVRLNSEQEFELATTVGACMNGWLYFLLGDLQQWLVDRGLKPEHARKLVLGNVEDCVAYARHHSSRALDELGRSIATPGTFTAEGLEMIGLRQANAAWGAASELVLDALVAQSGERNAGSKQACLRPDAFRRRKRPDRCSEVCSEMSRTPPTINQQLGESSDKVCWNARGCASKQLPHSGVARHLQHDVHRRRHLPCGCLVGLGDGTGNALSGSAAGCGGLRAGR